MVETTGWFFFLLVHSVYCGMLTTELSSPPMIPFETLDQGVANFPTWSLTILKGNEDVIQVNREKKHPVSAGIDIMNFADQGREFC